MKRLYEKSELAFTLIWIIGYVVLMSVADNLSIIIGVEKVITAIVLVVVCVSYALWILKVEKLDKTLN